MNLHSIVSGAIGTINPLQPIALQVSTGYTTAADGKRTPTYAAPVTLSAQIQELTAQDLRLLEGLDIQGSQKAMYCNGLIQGAVRVSQKGGDLVTTQDGNVWLTTAVLEAWPDWCKISVLLQNGS